jgi:hypothetical protein
MVAVAGDGGGTRGATRSVFDFPTSPKTHSGGGASAILLPRGPGPKVKEDEPKQCMEISEMCVVSCSHACSLFGFQCVHDVHPAHRLALGQMVTSNTVQWVHVYMHMICVYL